MADLFGTPKHIIAKYASQKAKIENDYFNYYVEPIISGLRAEVKFYLRQGGTKTVIIFDHEIPTNY